MRRSYRAPRRGARCAGPRPACGHSSASAGTAIAAWIAWPRTGTRARYDLPRSSLTSTVPSSTAPPSEISRRKASVASDALQARMWPLTLRREEEKEQVKNRSRLIDMDRSWMVGPDLGPNRARHNTPRDVPGGISGVHEDVTFAPPGGHDRPT